jgi:hypothetical protein
VVAMRDECDTEIGDVMRTEDRDEIQGAGMKVAHWPSERARKNLDLLYGGTGRTFQSWAVIGPTERHIGFSRG